MKMTRRLPIFVLIGLVSFFVGVSLTQLRLFLTPEHSEPSPWQVLLSFENQDLQSLNDEAASKVRQAVMEVTNQLAPDVNERFRPALFKLISNTSGEKRYMLVEVAQVVMIPGESWLRIHVFDNCGRVLSKDDFNAGYRMTVTGLQVRKSYLLDQDMLVVDCEPVFGGHMSREFYALVGKQIMLVYREWDGQFDPNDYDWPMTVGPKIGRSANEWETALGSADKAEVLATLMWLGGRHWNGQPAPYDDDRPEAGKVSLLRSRDRVRKRLMALSESEDYWLSTAAKAVLENNQ